MSPLWSKKTSVAATDARNIIILHRKIINYFSLQIFYSFIKEINTIFLLLACHGISSATNWNIESKAEILFFCLF